MSSSMVLYVELDLFCALYIGAMVVNILKSKASSREDKAFLAGAISIGTLLITDIIAAVLNGIPGELVRIVLYADNAIYFTATALGSYACLLYVDYMLTENTALVDGRRIMYLVPSTALVILSIASVKYGFIFYIGENNLYSRGELHIIQQIITTMYFVMAEFYAIYCLIKAKGYSRKSLCVKMLEFTTVPLLGLLLQIAFPGASIIWPMASIALFIMFSYSQNSLISMDALTGLNNRSRLIKYLTETCEKINANKKLVCVVFDIDSFKNINDRYGHSVGDEAIIQVADILRKSVNGLPGSNFVARYTGNSFAVVCSGDENHSELLLKNFDKNLEALNDSDRNPFQLSVSNGCAEFVKFEMTSDELLKLADNNMYKNKALKSASKQRMSVEDVVK